MPMAHVCPGLIWPPTSTRIRRDPRGGRVPSPEVPEELRADIEAHMALYPDPRSAILPALEAAQRVHGWCSPEAIDQVACVMRLTPAELVAVATFYDMLETTPVGRHSVYVCTNISCSLCGADELYEAIARRRRRRPGIQRALVRVPRRLRHRADGLRRRRLRGSAQLEDVPALLDDIRAGREVLPEKQLSRAGLRRPGGRLVTTGPSSTASTSPG